MAHSARLACSSVERLKTSLGTERRRSDLFLMNQNIHEYIDLGIDMLNTADVFLLSSFDVQ
jgi:hypothetical protein